MIFPFKLDKMKILNALLLICLFASCKESPETTDFFNPCDHVDSIKPNILFCIADDWGWPHASAYGDLVINTPVFDRLTQEGVLFNNAFVSSPSCTPSRSAILTGQDFWRLGESANLWSTLDVNLPVYPLILENQGYFVGSWRKSWGPGNLKYGGYFDKEPAGKKYDSKNGFKVFLKEKPNNTPFCFWFGTDDPHRPYENGKGKKSGIDISLIDVPEFYPDVEEIRNDIADYYFEIQRFDSDVGKAIELLDSLDELENTIVVITGDHGMPFPRCKANLYDLGVRVPLVISWGNFFQKGKVVNDFVSLTDLAPTFLELSGSKIPDIMTGNSLVPFLTNCEKTPTPSREFVISGRERHTLAQLNPSTEGYPSRSIRTEQFLYIHNFFSDRWPVGVSEGSTYGRSYGDCDESPTKNYLLNSRDQEGSNNSFELCFGKRPQHELYDVSNDPFQVNNLAYKFEHQYTRDQLFSKLFAQLASRRDPRVIGGGDDFDKYPLRR